MKTDRLYQYFPIKIRTLRDQRFLIVWTLISFVLTVLLTGVFAIFWYKAIAIDRYFPRGYGFGGPGGNDEMPMQARVPPWVVFGTDKLTFILLGYDQVDEFAHRSDTLMVGAVDFLARKVRIVSIPRDTLVNIPRYGFMKVNAAYALGGDDLVRRTTENFLGVEVDYVVSVNYQAFVEIVDALGGVDITVERAMNYDDRRGNVHIHIEPGEHHFDGQEALNYARFRHDATGDLGRIQRQQALMRSLFDQAISPSNWLNLSNVPGVVITNLSVSVNEDSPRNPPDIEMEHLLSLIGFLTQVTDNDIAFYQIPTEDIIYERLSCLRPIYSQTSRMLDEVFRDDDPVAWGTETQIPSLPVPPEENEEDLQHGGGPE